MATRSKSFKLITGVRKHLVNAVFPRATASVRFSSRRSGHSSAYDKNVEDELNASAVPDEVIQPESDQYWSPHPRTGVFGPSTTEQSQAGEARQDTAELEETAWFRPTSLEDSDKSHHV